MLITKYTGNDFGEYFDLVDDAEVMAYITGEAITYAVAKEKYTNILMENVQHKIAGHYKVSLSGKTFGYGKAILLPTGDVEIGYMLAKLYWNKGYGTKIAQKMLEFSRKILLENAKGSIYAIIDPKNNASKIILERVGFVSEWKGIKDGLPYERLIYEQQFTFF